MAIRYTSYGMSVLLALCCLLGWFAGKASYQNWQAMKLARESRAWPATVGTIINSELIRAGRYNHTTAARIRYSYNVNGQQYSFNRVGFTYDRTIYSYGQGKYFADKYKPGQRVEVFYKPDDPRQATLVKGPREGDETAWARWLVFFACAGLSLFGFTGYYGWKWKTSPSSNSGE